MLWRPPHPQRQQSLAPSSRGLGRRDTEIHNFLGKGKECCYGKGDMVCSVYVVTAYPGTAAEGHMWERGGQHGLLGAIHPNPPFTSQTLSLHLKFLFK